MAGIADDNQGFDVFYGDNVDFTGNVVPAATMLLNGQLLIGSTSGRHIQVGTLTSPDSSITIGYSSPNITLRATTTGFIWSDETVNFNALVNNGYFIAASVTANLPASPANGSTISFFVDGAFTLTIQANTGQTIKISSNVSSSAGTQVNTASGDAVTLVYRSTNTRWEAINFVGAWNFT